MLGHIGFYVKDLKKSNDFYLPLLTIIGYTVIVSLPNCIGYGINGVPLFEIYSGKPSATNLHVAFNVSNQNAVNKFYNKGLELGGIDNGAPGYREYFPNYYAAFFIDPDGNNIEAVYFNPSK